LEEATNQQAAERNLTPLSSVDEIVEEISVCSLSSNLLQHITCYKQFCKQLKAQCAITHSKSILLVCLGAHNGGTWYCGIQLSRRIHTHFSTLLVEGDKKRIEVHGGKKSLQPHINTFVYL
jgi:hypothetical protein